ncbi:MAG: hypothetical protein LLF80_02135 [Porphyromonadaceae bacterium]|nr:hypothetical protein [Porphyromonadaceae bacterium]
MPKFSTKVQNNSVRMYTFFRRLLLPGYFHSLHPSDSTGFLFGLERKWQKSCSG